MEVDLVSENDAHFVYPECVEKFEETKETDGFIMIAYPNLVYAVKNKDHALKNISYLERDKDFSGFIYYYSMNGNFVNGW